MTETVDQRQEEWRPAIGLPGYEVSDQGRVRSKNRFVMRNGWPVWTRGRVLRPNVQNNKMGHLMVHPCVGGVRVARTVHRLVAEAFIGPRPDGLEIAHWDGDPSNNRVSNLRYATRAENAADSRRHGTVARGERNGQRRLSRDEVLRIAELLNEGKAQQAIADAFGVHRSTVQSIHEGRCWAWLTGRTAPGPRVYKPAERGYAGRFARRLA